MARKLGGGGAAFERVGENEAGIQAFFPPRIFQFYSSIVLTTGPA